MSRKIFLSFLGTNDYVQCNYCIGDFKDENQKYIQVSLMKYLSADFSETDKCYVFLTEEARRKNWDFGNHTEAKDKNTGLRELLEREQALGAFRCGIEGIHIPDGFTHKDVWEMFDIIYKLLGKGDEIYLDITNAFRYFPMLGFALLNYARVLKSTKAQAIFYGAFEKLGPAFEVRKMPIENRNAEILNLITMDLLQQWTEGSADFIKTGNCEILYKLTANELKPLLVQTETRTAEIAALNFGIKELNDFTIHVATNRCKTIESYQVKDKITKRIQTYLDSSATVGPAFRPLVSNIITDLQYFTDDAFPRWLASSKFSFSKKLYQQSFTQLQEGIITEIIYKSPKEIGLTINDRTHRRLASEATTIFADQIPQAKWNDTSKEHADISLQLQALPFLQSVARIYKDIEGKRNDINHCGYTEPSSPDKLINFIEEKIAATEKIIKNPVVRKVLIKPSLFLNVSNHPINTWIDEQVAQANEYGEIKDLLFPYVPPQATEDEVHQMAEEKFLDISTYSEKYSITVHLMGELTFTYALVQKLKSVGISCVASTTERIIKFEQDGTKTSTFTFVRFREY